MSTQPEEVPSSQKPKDRVRIQALNDTTLKICNDLKKSGQKQKEDCFSASKIRKVHPSVLIKRLDEFKKMCDSTRLKSQLEGVITAVSGMRSGGESRMFTCHDNQEDGSKLEFICAIVHKYICEGEVCGCRACKACKNLQGCGFCRTCKACQEPLECRKCATCQAGEKCKEPIPCGECKACKKCRTPVSCGRCEACRECEGPVACDFVLTTYSYKEKGDRKLVRIGASTITGGIIVGGVVLVIGICTGGIGFTIAGIIAGAAVGGGAGIAGGLVIAKGVDVNISADLKTVLEACFVYELVERKFAQIQNKDLYLQLND